VIDAQASFLIRRQVSASRGMTATLAVRRSVLSSGQDLQWHSTRSVPDVSTRTL
jgi:hypothetical protein